MGSNSKRLNALPITLILGVMIALFAIELPHLHVDLSTEVDYLQKPYQMIAEKHVHITDGDPFAENGPQSIFPPAAILYYSHSLTLMRCYLFLYSLILVAFLFFLFIRTTGQEEAGLPKVFSYALIALAAWITIPLILVYPIQVNGMTPGFICFILGLVLNKKNPYAAMMLFGLAYSFKGQFLALLPGILFYKAFFERSQPLRIHLQYLLISLILFFVPATLFITSLSSLLGMFDNMHELKTYALRAPTILFNEFSGIGHRLAHAAPPDARAARVRHKELAGYGLVTWLHVGLSVLFSLGMITRKAWERFVKRPIQLSSENDMLTLFAFAALPYWLNFFFFWGFPYWYNTLVVVFFNIYLVPFVFFKIQHFIGAHLNRRWKTALIAAAVLVSVVMIAREVKRAPGIRDPSAGDALIPFSWMTPVPKSGEAASTHRA